ncbi:hypothetical protein AB0P17_18885 [Streptomyces sp. NPDC088124]|uniref:hypothetical protein n=1 Tax=Streptomyces sp. NPDC088124 TaxID=3154654 RepID=UPI0034397A7F
MPTWITPRRLGATAALYAVFVGGWYFGQPLPNVGCRETAVFSGEPVTISEPGDIAGALSRTARTVGQVATVEVIDTAAVVPCDGTPRPRLVAWATGDWR